MTVYHLKHTADIKVKIINKTKKEIFKEAIDFIASTLSFKTKSQIKNLNQYKIQKFKISNPKNKIEDNILLINLLNKIIYFSQTKKEVYFFKTFEKFSQSEVIIHCYKVKTDIKRDIKAVTYYDSKFIKNKKGKWELKLTFDV
jgi:SHS2 domain-containing protein